MRTVKPRINLEVIGRVDDSVVSHVLKVLRDFYERLEPDIIPEMVDVQVFARRNIMLGFLSSALEGVEAVYPFDEAYTAMHEAWSGIPKIYVCAEDFERLPRNVFNAALQHEAAHSVLHGSPEYYVINIPASLVTEFRRRGFTDEEVSHLAYLGASALKDLEASKLLERLGYVEDQVAFILHNLKMEASDLAAWAAASLNSKMSLIYLVHMLKALAASIPFLNSKHGRELADKRRKACSHLNGEHAKILQNLEKALERVEGDFHEKVVSLLRVVLKSF